jgi:hypothetical protein
MKLKANPERTAAVRRKECVVEGCTRQIHGFGFCRECLAELNKALEESPPASGVRKKI